MDSWRMCIICSSLKVSLSRSLIFQRYAIPPFRRSSTAGNYNHELVQNVKRQKSFL
jgi:hypothetical protein